MFFLPSIVSVLLTIYFFIHATMANDLKLQKNSIPDFIHYIFGPILVLEKQPVLSF